MADMFKEDYYAPQWMEWRSSIETGELTTNIAAIPETERELAAKYKAAAASAPGTPGSAQDDACNIYVKYAVAFVLGRHYDYVTAIWYTLVCKSSVRQVCVEGYSRAEKDKRREKRSKRVTNSIP
jgi:hypothetical protein